MVGELSSEALAVSSAHRTGRTEFLASLKDDPFWPTRNPISAALSLASGRGRSRHMPPGPIGLPVIGAAISLERDPYEFFADCARKYGDIYRVPVPGVTLVMANHPDLTSYFMEDTDLKYSMSAPLQGRFGQWVMERIGSPVQALEGAPLRERRRLLMPMFGKRHLANMSDIFVDVFVDRIDQWAVWADSGQEVDLQHELPNITLPAFMRAMFSSSITDQQIREIDVDIRTIMRGIGAAVLMGRPPRMLPLPGKDSLPRSMVRIALLVRQLIRQRRANPTDAPDLLNVLLDARNADGTPLREGDLILEIIGLIGGGYETVVASLSWTLALLLNSPGDLARLYDEIEILGGNAPGAGDLPKLEWAKACFDEGQRLQGAPMNPRIAMVDDEIAGYPIRKGTIVGTSLYVVHRDPRWWGENANEYDPMHFYDAEQVAARPRLAFLAFGAGPHHCMGTGMAYMNAQYLLALIFQRYRLRLRPGWTPRHNFTFSTTVKGGVPVTIHRA